MVALVIDWLASDSLNPRSSTILTRRQSEVVPSALDQLVAAHQQRSQGYLVGVDPLRASSCASRAKNAAWSS